MQQVLEEKSIKIFVLYENLLLDVTKYSENHPGGRNLINDNIFSDISRYISGNQGYSAKVSSHDHTLHSCLYAIKSLSYAKFEDEHRIVLKNNKNAYLNNDMFFDYKYSIADNTFSFNFSNEPFKFSVFLPGINWLGRHFAISSTELNKTRYYSLCLCLNKKIQDKIYLLFENIISLENKNPIKEVSLNEKEPFTNTITFYIKKYEYKGALSMYLHGIRSGYSSKMNIRGPIVNYI